jgi:diphthamide biosynthesis methyltransferase
MSARVLSVRKVSLVVSGSPLHATAEGDLRLKSAIQHSWEEKMPALQFLLKLNL